MDDAKVIIGLGNVGERYSRTRHNIGFMVVDALADKYEVTFREESKFKCHLAKIVTRKQDTILLVKPTTYMNLSGESVQALTRYYKIPMSQVLVIYDDIDLPYGKLRFRPDGSAGTHNGMKSIIAETGTAEFARLRVGVNPPPKDWDLADYVLSAFNEAELPYMEKLLAACIKATACWLKDGTQTAMNRYNGPPVFEWPPKPPESESIKETDKPLTEEESA